MAHLSALPWHAETGATIDRLLARGVHAVLLHGPAGIGKLDLALETAGGLLCEGRGENGAPCGSCHGCALIAAGNHPDLCLVRPAALADAELRPSGEPDGDAAEGRSGTASGEGKGRAAGRQIEIDQIRELSSWATLSTHRGGARVIVLEPVEAMKAPASNALLKILEEPPARTVFLLVSHRIDETLPTLRSRCALVRVPLPPEAVAVRWLESQGIEQPRRRLIEAGGAPLPAAQADRNGLTPELRDLLLGLLRKGARLTPAELAGCVPRDVPVAASVALFQRWGWDFLSFSLAGTVRYHSDETAALRQLGTHWQVPQACSWIGELQLARSFADHPLNAKLAIEGMLLAYVRSIHGTPASPGR